MAVSNRLSGLLKITRQLSKLGQGGTRIVFSPKRGFCSTAVMSKEQMDEIKNNPYFAKYADKIAKLQETSPEEFMSRLEAAAEKKEAAQPPKQPSKQPEVKDYSLPGKPLPNMSSQNPATQKSLDKILKMELIQDKTKEEIAKIWTKHFSEKEAVAAVIPADTFRLMEQRFKEFGTFLFPVPRKNGYEFVVVQFLNNEAHFTSLINFQAHKENAPECMNIVHYTELIDSKGIVLMVGEYDNQSLTRLEAKCLADQVEIYYSRPSDRKLELMKKFTYQSAYFQHQQLIDEMNSLSLE